MAVSYSQAFQSPTAARHYEENIYEPAGQDAFIWSLEREYLHRIVQSLPLPLEDVDHLDFACGTGRILRELERGTRSSLGWDISRSMLEIARTKVQRARLRVGNLVEQPELLPERFDLITAFRFFLNAEHELRTAVMQQLASRLRGADSRFVFSVQGHSRSARHVSQIVHRLRGGPHREMSMREIRALVASAGLQIERWFGFGLCPRFMYRPLTAGVARTVDGFAGRHQLLRGLSYNLIFVCRRP